MRILTYSHSSIHSFCLVESSGYKVSVVPVRDVHICESSESVNKLGLYTSTGIKYICNNVSDKSSLLSVVCVSYLCDSSSYLFKAHIVRGVCWHKTHSYKSSHKECSGNAFHNINT